MKEFQTAVRDATASEEDEGTVFLIDGVECRCYKPQPAQLAVLLATISRQSDWTQQVAGVINFFVEVLDEKSHSYVVGRLLDRNDPFEITDVEAIIEWMVEDWTGNPTQSPSGSTPSPPNGGQKSTPRTRKSTSSRSLRPASATSSSPGV